MFTEESIMSGIVGYGAYVPRYRIKISEISKVWGGDGERVSRGLNVKEKTVPDIDEDVVTISVSASRLAIKNAGIDPQKIGAIYVGSESHPYAVKPSATIVAEACSATPNLTAADFEFACKAGTAAIQTCLGLVKSNMIEYGLAIGADTSQGRPGDPLEYTASAGGAAFIIGNKDVICEIKDTCSYTTDTPDFWRREGQDFPRHGSRFTGEPAYFKHVMASTKMILERNDMKPNDFDYAIFHQPNGKFPLVVGPKLGFTKEQVLPGLLTPLLGNTYSGATPLALSAILDNAKAGDKILVTSYGSGAGSDSFIMETTKLIEKKRNHNTLERQMEHKTYIEYSKYAKFKGKIKGVNLQKG